MPGKAIKLSKTVHLMCLHIDKESFLYLKQTVLVEFDLLEVQKHNEAHSQRTADMPLR